MSDERENGRDEMLDTIVNAEKWTARQIALRFWREGDRRAARTVADWYDVPIEKVAL